MFKYLALLVLLAASAYAAAAVDCVDNQFNAQVLTCYGTVTEAPTGSTASPTMSVSSLETMCTFLFDYGKSQVTSLYACVFETCTVASCISACSNSTTGMVVPFLGSTPLTLTAINNMLTSNALSLSSLTTGTCTPLTCNDLCGSGSSTISLSAAAAVAMTMVAASLTR